MCPDVQTTIDDPRPAPAPVDPTRLLGRRIGNYRLTALIGVGGMGAVYRAENLSLQRPAAVKSLQGGGMGSSGLRRFLREARMLARLDHPNIVRIYDVARDAQCSYLIMEYVEGRDLEVLRTTRKLAVATCVKLLIQVARALAAAHGLGIVHRDIKPANILLSHRGRVKVTDFGLARPQGVTEPGAVVGTPYYMAPEQAQGLEVDARADIYALGATAYSLLADQPPYEGSTPLSVMVQHVDPDTRPAPLRSLNPRVPAPLEALVARMMAQRPEDRFASMAEVVQALTGCLRTKAAARPRRLRRWLAGGLAAACLLLGGLYHSGRDARDFRALQATIEAQPDKPKAAAQLAAFQTRYPDSRFAAVAARQQTEIERELAEDTARDALRRIEQSARAATAEEDWQRVIADLHAWLQAHPESRARRIAQRGLEHAHEQQALLAIRELRAWRQEHPTELAELELRLQSVACLELDDGQIAHLQALREAAHRDVLEQRFGLFMKAFHQRDGARLVGLCDPQALREVERDDARKLLQGLFGLTSLLGWELETWQLVDCSFEAESLHAQLSLEMQLRHRSGQRQTESSSQSWRYVDGSWYLSPRG